MQDGLNKVVEGETSFEEILKIVDLENDVTTYKDDNLMSNLKMAQKAHKESEVQNNTVVTPDSISNFETLEF